MHPREISHLERTLNNGRYVCDVCHNYIDEGYAQNHLPKVWRDRHGNLHRYHTKKHKGRCPN